MKKLCCFYPTLEDYDPRRRELCEAGGDIARIPCTAEDEETCDAARRQAEDDRREQE